MTRISAHIVHVDKRKNFSSTTLPADALQRLEASFRAIPWWRDKWTAKTFRVAARDVHREHGGLVLIGPGVKFDIPPPFLEMFEAIEIGTGLGDDGERLKVLSGDAPTSQERWRRIGKWIAVTIATAFVLMFGALIFRGMPQRVLYVVLGAIGFNALVVLGIFSIQGMGKRCFLIPGGIALVRRPVRRGQPPRITVLSRRDSCVVIRYVHHGKTVVLTLELWTHAGGKVSRAVSEREAMSLIATWQGTVTPPGDEKLMELVSW